MAKEEKKKKTKRPTAEKRDIQNSKRRMRNKVFKSQVKTAIRKFESIRGKGDTPATKAQLNEVYSLLDKGVKHGIFKLNKASRTKSRLAARAVAKS